MANADRDAQCILVADSEVLVRHAIADYLRDCGYVVIEAASSDEAQVVIADRTIRLDAVLCDAKLDGSMNGFELKAWSRQQRSGLEIIIAGNVESAALKAAQICEDGPHLARPYDPQLVVDYVKRLLGGAGKTAG